MRRLVLVTAVAVMAITAVAYAVTDTVSYSAKYSKSSKPTKSKPANMSYTGILHVDTNPPGSQPDTAPTTSIYYSKAVKNNAPYFPFCNQSEIDGQSTFPAKCNKAIVGAGTAKSLAGTPGQPDDQAITENLTVKAVNGPKGKVIFLVLNSAPGAPVAITNRVVPGAVVKASGTFGYVTRFQVPQDLQEPVPGVKVALTDFTVKISGTPRKVKIKGKTQKVSYLQLTSCSGSLPAKAIANFTDSDTGAQKTVTSTSSAKC